MNILSSLRVLDAINDALQAEYPPVEINTPEHIGPCIPQQHVTAIAEELTFIIAHVVASYIDAGSERDAVMENLTPYVEHELRQWSDAPENFTTPTT